MSVCFSIVSFFLKWKFYCFYFPFRSLYLTFGLNVSRLISAATKNVSFASAYFAPTCEIMHTFDVVIKIVLILKKAKKKRLKKGLKHKIDWYL